MKKYALIFLLFILTIISQIISIHNKYIEKQEIVNNRRNIDRLIEIGFDDEAEKIIDKFKNADDDILLMKIAISKGNLYKALEIAEQHNIFDMHPKYILTLSEAFYNKGQFSKAYKTIVKNHGKINDEKLNNKVESLLVKMISEVRITEVDFEISGDWSSTGESMVIEYNSGKYIINEDGNISSNKYDEIFEEDGNYIVSSNGIKFSLKLNGKFNSFLDDDDKADELMQSERFKNDSVIEETGITTANIGGAAGKTGSTAAKVGNAVTKTGSAVNGDSIANINKDFNIIKKTENSGLLGYSYKDYEIVKPEYTMATSINRKGIGFIKAEDKWYKIQFLVFSDY